MEPNPSRCLLCFGNCSNLQVISLWNGEIPGAVHCSTLKRQLQNLFILRNILDVDASWCEETLRRRSEVEEEFKMTFVKLEEDPFVPRDNGNLEFWFKLCNVCTGRVEEAWRLYQKLLEIQTKINGIKDEIKNVMKEGIRKNSEGNEEGIADDIRKIVFPDLQPETDFCYEAFPPGDSDDFVDDFVHMKVEASEPSPVEMKLFELKRPKTKSAGGPSRKIIRSAAASRISRRHLKRAPFGNGLGPRMDTTKEFKLWQCPKCNNRFRDNNPEKIKIHLERHEKSEEVGGGEFDCPHCTFPARDAFELEVHLQNRHVAPKRPKMHKCPKDGCNFKTRVLKSMMTHTQECHPELNLEEFKVKEDFLCSQCTRVFSNSNSLAVHQKSSHPQLFGSQLEEVQCNQCDLKFPAKIHLQDHINNVHIDKCLRRFICDDCGLEFQFLSKLNDHKIVHSNKTKRDYVCHICGVDYSRKQSLKKHMKKIHGDDKVTVAGEKAPNLKCRFCQFETPFRPALKKHLESHKEGLGFKCEMCSKSYTNAQALKTHIKINHGDTEVSCPCCNRKYRSMRHMKDHLKKFCKMKELKEQM